jgi:Mor family transcriptional regulator
MDSTDDDALDVIEQEAEAVGLALGHGEPVRLARMLAERISQRLGGRLVYVAKRNREALEARNASICAAFNGRNIPELAAEHQITERQVRKILRTCPVLPVSAA